MSDETKRLYHAGHAITKAERNLAWGHTPVDTDGEKMRWNFSAKMTCSRGPKCNYSHQLMKSTGLRWAVYAEFLRRDGHRRAQRLVEVKDIEGRIRQLRETDATEIGWNQQQ